jgi:hypothetical protein
MQADIPTLEKRVADIARRSSLGARLQDISLEPARDDEGSDFLRIVLEMKTLDSIPDEEIEALVSSIEKGVSELDERFPSVRFADAA